MLRTFLAIELAEPVRLALKQIQYQFKKSLADVKWVRPENLHMTLKFLGDIPPEKINTLIQTLKEILVDWNFFSWEVTHLGAFPKIENPQINWAGIDLGKDELKRMVFTIDEKIHSLGFEKENRDFAAHITLGRLKSSVNRGALSHSIKDYSFPSPLTQKVKQIILFKSILNSDGPVYEVLAKFDLKEL